MYKFAVNGKLISSIKKMQHNVEPVHKSRAYIAVLRLKFRGLSLTCESNIILC